MPKDALVELVIIGTYYANAGDNARKVVRAFRGKAKLPATELHREKSILKNYFLPRFLPLKYPDFVALRTFEVIKHVPLGDFELNEDEPSLMSREQIEAYAETHNLDLIPELYDDLSALRQALKDCLEHPEQFKRNQDILWNRKKDELTLKSVVYNANKALFDIDVTVDEELPPNGNPA